MASTLDPVVTGDWVTLHKYVMKSCLVFVIDFVAALVIVKRLTTTGRVL